MNLFLLTAVPLAAVAFHSFFHPDRRPFADPKSWIQGAVWSMLALVVAAFFGKGREFTGDFWQALFGLTLADVILVPGAVVAAWVVFRRSGDLWELSLWLGLVFTMAGIRDFFSTSRIFDLGDLFLVPLDRVLLVFALPPLVGFALGAVTPRDRAIWIAAASGLGLTGSLFPLMTYAGWAWLPALLTLGGLAGVLWVQKKAVPGGNGFSAEAGTTSEEPRERP